MIERAVEVVILCKIPKSGIYFGSDPLDVITRVIAGDQRSIMIYCEEFVFFLCVVPDAGIYDNLLSVIYLGRIGNTDFFGRVQIKIILC